MDNKLIKQTNKTFDIFDAALACVIFIVLNFVFLQLFYSLPSAMKTEPLIYLASFLLEAIFGVVSWIVAKTRNINLLQEAGFNKKINGNVILYGFLIAVASLVFFGRLTYSFMDLLDIIGYKSTSSNIVIDNFGIYIVYVIISCLAPAVFEEMLFRGVILTGLKKYGKIVAVVVSSIVFMLMHGSPDQTVHQFIVGMILGYIFYMSGNIWLGVVIHFFNNFISVTELYLVTMISPDMIQGAETEVASASPSLSSFFLGLILALGLAFIGYFVIKKLVSLMLKASENANSKTTTINIAESLDKSLINGELSENSSENTNKLDDFNDYNVLDGSDKNGEQSTSNLGDAKLESSTSILSEENSSVEGQQLNDSTNESNGSEQNSDNKKELLSIGTITMLVLSGGYLIFQWLLAFISGFMG